MGGGQLRGGGGIQQEVLAARVTPVSGGAEADLARVARFGPGRRAGLILHLDTTKEEEEEEEDDRVRTDSAARRRVMAALTSRGTR